MRYILGSGSPRRKELLGLILPEFEVIASRYDEHTLDRTGLSPEAIVKKLALEKAREVFSRMEGEVCVIGGDTIVLSPDGEIMGKPASEEDAHRMLRELSGKTHAVLSGAAVCLRKGKVCTEEVFSVRTEVSFYPLSESEILRYLQTGEPFDKAGSYGIQGKGGLFVREISGDYNNVVGLPAAALAHALVGMGAIEEILPPDGSGRKG